MFEQVALWHNWGMSNKHNPCAKEHFNKLLNFDKIMSYAS